MGMKAFAARSERASQRNRTPANAALASCNCNRRFSNADVLDRYGPQSPASLRQAMRVSDPRSYASRRVRQRRYSYGDMHIMMPRGADHELDEAHAEPPIKVMPARAFGFRRLSDRQRSVSRLFSWPNRDLKDLCFKQNSGFAFVKSKCCFCDRR
jgi:hypothetical protein